MRIHLIAVGRRLPAWVDAGYQEYARRLPRHCALTLVEIPQASGAATPAAVAMKREAGRIAAAIPKDARVIACDERGENWTSKALAQQMQRWLGAGHDLVVLIGGAAGLDPDLRRRADQIWSLSALTLPHGLARVLVAEQLYRAVTLLTGHPYHRE
jgi:23S rRNA (pseudouridine1915-N3)-methyltransferase